MYLDQKFCYAAIKVTERQTKKTEELLGSLFNPKESGAIERKIDCKVITYAKCKEDDKHNDNERNESNKNQQLISLIMSSDAEDILIQIV